jgi:hypothetical protein
MKITTRVQNGGYVCAARPSRGMAPSTYANVGTQDILVLVVLLSLLRSLDQERSSIMRGNLDRITPSVRARNV